MSMKDPNPKDAVGVRKWRQLTSVPMTVIWEVGVAMLEGARKYGRHNYRAAPVRASVYIDSAIGHISQFWEGEDIDAESKINHLTKGIANLIIVRDAMMRGTLIDDRPPAVDIDTLRADLQAAVDHLFEAHPTPAQAYTHEFDADGPQNPPRPGSAEQFSEVVDSGQIMSPHEKPNFDISSLVSKHLKHQLADVLYPDIEDFEPPYPMSEDDAAPDANPTHDDQLKAMRRNRNLK